jgi:hypothetical protein
MLLMGDNVRTCPLPTRGLHNTVTARAEITDLAYNAMAETYR